MAGVLILGMLAAVRPVLAADPVAPARPAAHGAVEWTERLAEINPVPGPITLRGDHGEFELFFNLSTRVDPAAARLHLEVSNSQALLAGRSQLVIRLNDVVVAQLGLKPDAPLSSVDVELPVELLRGGANRLNFLAAQHYTNECESPAAAELWSQIDTTRSRLSIHGRPVDTAPLLSDLQDLIGPGFFGGRDITLMTPETAEPLSDMELATGSTLAQALALRLRYQPAMIGFASARPDGGSGPGLHLAVPPPPPVPSVAPGAERSRGQPDIVLFGTLDALRPMLGPEIAAAVTGGFIGVYALPGDASRLAMVVSGRDKAELARAATALGVANFPFVDSPQQTVEDIAVQPRDSFFATPTLREGATTSFAELGFKTVTLRGGGGRAGLEVLLPADLYVADSAEAELSLDYAYSAGLRPDSVMHMSINGEFQQAIPLPDRAGGVLRGYRIRLPARKLMPGRNRIEFEAILAPLVSGACVAPETRNMVLTLSGTSTISLAQGAHYAAQPDLRLFSTTGFPYVGAPAFDLALAARDPATAAAAWTLSARLAQLAGRVLTEARVMAGAPAPGRHAILVGAVPDLPAELAAALPVRLGAKASLPYTSPGPVPEPQPPAWQLLSGLVGLAAAGPQPPQAPASRLAGSGTLGRNGLVMAAQTPGAGTFTLTAFTAETPDALRTAMRALVRPQVWPRMEDDVVLWRPAAAGIEAAPAVSAQRVGPTYHLGSVDSLRALRYLVGEYTWIWVAALVAAVLVSAVMLRLLVVLRLRRRHRGSAEGIP